MVIPCWLFSQQVFPVVLTTGKVYQVTQQKTSYTFDSGRYTVFIPDGVQELRGVLVHQHGCTMEGRGAATAFDVQYQALAKKWGLAIVGPDLYSAKGNCHDWRNPESGSGEALIDALTAVGRLSGHPELAGSPWLLWGHSGGGYWALSMLRIYPERIIGVFGYSPAFEPGAYPAKALKVPVMMRHAGPSGDACCWRTSITEFGKLRNAGGYVSIAYTPYQNHNYSWVRYMAIPFFESVLQQRLPVGTGKDYHALRDMDPAQAWLGDTTSYNISPVAAYNGQRKNACWFSDSLTAARWREYVITGTLIDRTPPPAPYATKIQRRHNVTVALYWKADADVESGISHFNIYKDGQWVQRYPATGVFQHFDTNGDDAIPLTVPLLQTDLTYLWNESGKISISTVNAAGLESARTPFPSR
ncbi:alpha/beta hydrolase [Flavihumibacter petaseus]|uniref:Uncharacterized protein n=1 Tax=Flavihumibacter petaseus NBRC 106054 TaxID=1220578 RepID=A0A0E9MZC1_9BACT|nr:alpha/beta hydrolase [Flavihumibacter petaseus]GAO43092.1 hypothetical protein FPE01S_02_01960 [Flavihumibacter petaseus NBRC 106054]